MARSKRDPLRALSTKLPAPGEAAKLLQTLHHKDDRSVALVFAALIDAVLEKLIIKKFPRMTPQLEGRLFKNRGPLCDFDSKILIAEALRIIPDIDYVVPLLNSIKAIRNVFGHSIVDVSFDTKEISDEIAANLMPFALTLRNALFEVAGSQEGYDIAGNLSNKLAFSFVALMICGHLDDEHQQITGEWLVSVSTRTSS